MTRPTCITQYRPNFSLKVVIALCVTFLGIGSLAGCEARVSSHGHMISKSELNKMSIGITTRADILEILGPPSFSGAFNKKKIYYSSQIMRQAVAGSKEIDQRFTYIFTLNDEQFLESIVLLNKEDGLKIAHIDSETPTPGDTFGVIEQVFTNMKRRRSED